MKKLLTIFLTVLMVLVIGVTNVTADDCDVSDVIEELADLPRTPVKVTVDPVEYSGKRQAATFKLVDARTGEEIEELNKVVLSDIFAKDESCCKTLKEVINEFAENDFAVVYTQDNKIVAPILPGEYKAYILLKKIDSWSYYFEDSQKLFSKNVVSVNFTITPRAVKFVSPYGNVSRYVDEDPLEKFFDPQVTGILDCDKIIWTFSPTAAECEAEYAADNTKTTWTITATPKVLRGKVDVTAFYDLEPFTFEYSIKNRTTPVDPTPVDPTPVDPIPTDPTPTNPTTPVSGYASVSTGVN